MGAAHRCRSALGVTALVAVCKWDYSAVWRDPMAFTAGLCGGPPAAWAAAVLAVYAAVPPAPGKFVLFVWLPGCLLPPRDSHVHIAVCWWAAVWVGAQADQTGLVKSRRLIALANVN